MLGAVCLFVGFEPAFAEADSQECIDCHTDAVEVQRVLDPKLLGKSVHADLECAECHESVPSPDHPKKLPAVNCASCHEDQAAEYEGSVHALAEVKEERYQPGCKACHGTHEIFAKKNKRSMINPANLAATCGSCHSKKEVMRRFGARAIDPVALYQRSVHARVLREHPEKKPATCIDCHNSHGIFPPLNPKSTFSKFAVPKTCGKCHEEISKQYQESVHWDAVLHGHYEAPVCYDCHGEHEAHVVTRATNAAVGAVDDTLASTQLCANCHANSVMMARFGLNSERFSSYMKTYHGLAVLRGSPKAASCVSCHEKHSIRSRTDPFSAVHQDNLEKTCGNCHKSTNTDFAQVPVHPLNLKERNAIAYAVQQLYLWGIVFVLGGMLLHNAIIMAYYVCERWRERKKGTLVRRFSDFQVLQHFLLILSFTILAITGFALVYSGAGWVQLLTALGMTEALRAMLHRAAALMLIGASLAQVVYFTFFKNGRSEIIALVPRWSDVTGFWRNMRYYLHLSGERPKSGRFDYTEKAEYLALIWGTAIMALSGLVLWFPEQFLNYMPVWAFEVSEVIHFFEAVLAVSAIVIWHLFFTIFHPEHYPMSLTWIDGQSAHKEEPVQKEEEEKKEHGPSK